MRIGIWLGATLMALGSVAMADEASQSVELGRIEWMRSLPDARKAAESSGKLIMILFDEIPGCDTCKQFGQGPLSHPIVVDAVAENFVATVVYNNVNEGQDLMTLRRYREAPWDNPVVRFLDSHGTDVMGRKAGDYSAGGLISRMAEALETAKRPVPLYLRLAAEEYGPAKRETVALGMHCYWVGEQKLGALDGVLATRIGKLEGMEVVELDYNPKALPLDHLLRSARRLECADKVFLRSDEQVPTAKKFDDLPAVRLDTPVDTSTTQQYNLSQKPQYHYLPLTQLQATKVNAAIASGEDADRFLSAGQLKLKVAIERLIEHDKDALADLNVDRTPGGLPGYARRLAERLGTK